MILLSEGGFMKSIRNFRSLGGIKTSLGTVKENKLLRGGPLSQVNNDDKVILTNSYDLSRIVDFRNTHEIEHEPDMVINNTINLQIPIMRDRDELSADPSKMAKKVEETKNSDFMYDIYRAFVVDPHASKGFASFLTTVAHNEDGSTFFHCTAGKDRTGFAAAVLLKILGADWDTIMTDYMETNKNVESHKESLLASVVRFHPFDTTNDELVMDILGVREKYLVTSFDLIEETYGTFDNYVKNGLNIDTEIINLLRKSLLD